jgi:hypothetical protein
MKNLEEFKKEILDNTAFQYSDEETEKLFKLSNLFFEVAFYNFQKNRKSKGADIEHSSIEQLVNTNGPQN